MGYHHIALATNDLEATHRFYTDAMGFSLAKAVVAPTPSGKGYAKHLFYDTGDGTLIAFWDLHDETIPEFDAAISVGAGLPEWVNHLAFDATIEQLQGKIDRWLEFGYDVAEIDHGFCRSVYAMDPNNILVEWCADVRPLNADDREHANRVLFDAAPELEEPPVPVFHEAKNFVGAT